MRSSLKVISSVEDLRRITPSWNKCMRTFSDNPFFLSCFAKQFMEFQSSEGWSPLFAVLLVGNRIVGIAPLVQKKLFGIKVAKFLYFHTFSPDLFVCEAHREDFLEKIVSYLFETCRFSLVDLVLSADSPSIPTLRKACKNTHVSFHARTVPELGKCVLGVDCNWDSYETSRGGNFRRKFRKMKRKLERAGSLTVEFAENPGNPDIYRNILSVEKCSWKETWRKRRGQMLDPDIAMLWGASQEGAKTVPDFAWKVWFLKLDSHTLAYAIVYEFKKATYICKISYDKKYRAFYPGIFLINAILRDYFDIGQTRKIDFHTDLPFMATWNPSHISRVRVMIGKGILPTLLAIGLTNDHLINTRNRVMNLLADRMPSSSNLLLDFK